MIRKTGGHYTPTYVSVVLQDDTGHRVEVVARIAYPLSPAIQECVLLEVRDLGQAAPEQDAEFWTQRDYEAADLGQPEPPPEARSLAPSSWGVSCPHCGSQESVLPGVVKGMLWRCQACDGLMTLPAGALTAAEAMRRPTEAKP